MSSTRLSIALATALVAATPAFAQDLSVSAGVALVTEYESNGLRQSDGPALQAYVEAGIAGFYAGIWASNVDENIIGPGDTLEYDLYLGYAGSVGSFSYDIGYAAYYYNESNFCCSDVIVSGEVALSDAVTVGLRFSSDPDTFDTVNSRIYGSYAITDAFSLDARYGSISNGGHDYWSVGASYAVSDTGTLFASYHETTIEADLFILGVSLDFSIR
jgi:uncharacterized protein (TIGR02001 family)